MRLFLKISVLMVLFSFFLFFIFFPYDLKFIVQSDTDGEDLLWGPCKKRSFEGEVRLWFEQVRMQGKETDKKTKSKESIGTMVNSLLSETGKCARH